MSHSLPIPHALSPPNTHTLLPVHTPSCHCTPLLQVYYELAAERVRQGKQGEVALIRVEQLAPFPFDLVMREMRRFPNAGACGSQSVVASLCPGTAGCWMLGEGPLCVRRATSPRAGGGILLGVGGRYNRCSTRGRWVSE